MFFNVFFKLELGESAPRKALNDWQAAWHLRINKIGDMVILVPVASKWDNFMKAIDGFSEDLFEDGRADQTGDVREEL